MKRVPHVKISYSFKAKLSDLPKVGKSFDAFNIAWNEWDHDKIGYCEQFGMLLLNRANKVLGFSLIGEGSQTATVVDIKRIFQIALKAHAANVILIHNHPSGNLKPSYEDLQITHKIIRAGEYMDIKILDHIILSPDKVYISLADEGHI